MKAFIVAMMVAAVAGQFNMYGQEKSMLMNKYYGQGNELYKKLGFMPTIDMYGQRDLYLQDQFVDKKIFTIEELYTTQLFKEYLALPIFREYIQKSPVFKTYVESVYFQKFWQIPAFKQYFVQPTLFYKYIYPIVQLFKYETITTPIEQELNKNVLPVYADYEPTVYNKEFSNGIFYKNLLEKLFEQLYKVDETSTYYQNKIVDPITGEIKMMPFQGVDTIFGDKLVKDVLLKKFLINKEIGLDHVFGDKLITDLMEKKNLNFDLIKKLILAKDMQTTLFGDDLVKSQLLSQNLDVELLMTLLKNVDPMLIKKIVLNKMLVGDNLFTNTLPQTYLKENTMSPIVSRMYKNMLPLTLDTMTKGNIFNALSKDLYNGKFDSVDSFNVFDILAKKNLVQEDKILLNKILGEKINEIENFGTYETIPKMVDDVTKFERVPLTLEGVKPMMGVRTFDKKIFPQVIKA